MITGETEQGRDRYPTGDAINNAYVFWHTPDNAALCLLLMLMLLGPLLSREMTSPEVPKPLHYIYHCDSSHISLSVAIRLRLSPCCLTAEGG